MGFRPNTVQFDSENWVTFEKKELAQPDDFEVYLHVRSENLLVLLWFQCAGRTEYSYGYLLISREFKWNGLGSSSKRSQQLLDTS